jgi:hypothetical protein
MQVKKAMIWTENGSYCWGSHLMVSITEAERIRRERISESRTRASETRNRRSEATAAAGAA